MPPPLALALIGMSWTGRPVRTASLAAGVSGVIAFGLLWNLTSLATIGDGMSMLTLGFGAWIILLAGIALGLRVSAKSATRSPQREGYFCHAVWFRHSPVDAGRMRRHRLLGPNTLKGGGEHRLSRQHVGRGSPANPAGFGLRS
jgi:hypothetical protein